MKYIIIILLLLLFPFQGCLKDNVTPAFNISLNTSALVLRYFEGQGDYINSPQMPSVVKADEVVNNLRNYLVLDVSSKNNYAAGHITGAISIANDTLIQYMENKNTDSYPKVVLVSRHGQAASYYTCLLRLYGFNNVYALLFGMGEWNPVFDSAWNNNLQMYAEYNYFTNENYPKPARSPLPSISLDNSPRDLGDKIKNRIKLLMQKGFADTTDFIKFTDFQHEVNSFYTVCFGRDSLYFHAKEGEIGSGHFPNTIYYDPASDIRSSSSLQTFPPDKNILIYSTSGHLSSFLTAYLRVMGYRAKTLLFGAGTMFQPYLFNNLSVFSPYVFVNSDVRNYPYTTGNKPD